MSGSNSAERKRHEPLVLVETADLSEEDWLDYRRRGIGSALVTRCVAALEEAGIAKIHLDVLAGNASAAAFWNARGWTRRDDIVRYSLLNSLDANA